MAKRKDEERAPKSKPEAERPVKKQKTEPAKPPKVKPASTLVQDEEKAFPRGGGSVLTPLEHRQIQVKAARDVLFEESGQGKRPAESESSDEELSEADTKSTKSPKKKKQRKDKAATKDFESYIKVGGLKFKRLVPGCSVLGVVTKITADELILDLANNLTGRVGIANISAQLGEQLGDESEADNVELHDMFVVGQYLRATVLSTLDEEGGKGRKRINLTIDPRHTNQRIDVGDIAVNFVCQAAISSIADHGFGMDLGFGKSVTGFMAARELPAQFSADKLKCGAVFLCTVSGLSSNHKVVKLSASPAKAALTNTPSVNALLPGTAVELLVTQVSSTTVAGKIFGLLDASADIVHSGAAARKADIESKYKIGDKAKARIVFKTADAESDGTIVGLSLLDHVLTLSPHKPQGAKALAIGTIVDKAKIVNVESGLGVFADVGQKGVSAFVHISKVADGRVEELSSSTGPFRSGTSHRARIIGYNAIDGVYMASFEKSTLDTTFLRLEDVPVAGVVKVTIEKLLVLPSGKVSLVVELAKGVTGLVPETHLSDIELQHPDRKFKPGMTLNARVLSVDLDRRQARLTLKKSLVNSDATLWSEYRDIQPGDSSIGTILTLDAKGALMQFFGNVRGFLPVNQMSDAFVDDPASHFRIGQVLAVHAVRVDPDADRLTISCRTQTSIDADKLAALASLRLGQLVSGTVTDKSEEDITVKISDSSLSGTLPIAHLSDGKETKSLAAWKQVRSGQALKDLVIVEIFEKKGSVVLSNKPSLVKEAKSGKVAKAASDLIVDSTIAGFVRNITDNNVFVQTLGGIVALLPRALMLQEMQQLPDFGLTRGKSISARVVSVKGDEGRVVLATKPVEEAPSPKPSGVSLVEPVDETLQTIDDLVVGKVTKARITSVKDTQLNVQLADGVQGRVDVSEAFERLEDIPDRKQPLRAFKSKSVIDVRVIGLHDARNHKFLPISHRGGKVPVFELSMKLDSNMTTLDAIQTGSWHAGYVNNVTDTAIWVNLSPSLRGRIEKMDASDDVSALVDATDSFPPGAALKVRVKAVDRANGRLDLSTKTADADKGVTFDSLTVGANLAGKVTRVAERSVLIELGPGVVGQIGLTDMADDYDLASTANFDKNAVVRVCVLEVDKPNKRISLTTRPSRVLSSSLPVKDKMMSKISDLAVNDLVRGFVKNVANVGLFLSLSHAITGFVRVSELSDAFVKDWKAGLEVGQLLTGKVISIDNASGNVQLSLKQSVLKSEYRPHIRFENVEVGQILTGKVRKVEEFGVFIVIDNSANVSGLCHRSEMADGRRVADVASLYDEGDAVKAKVLKIDLEKRRISLGLKASYFGEVGDEESDEEDVEGGVDIEASEDSFGFGEGAESESDSEVEDEIMQDLDNSDDMESDTEGLDAGEFNWDGDIGVKSQDTPKVTAPKKQNPGRVEDVTGTLDAEGPSSADDYERLLLTERDSAALWVGYMSMHVSSGDLARAREIAERALGEIPIRAQDEKRALWLAYLNLEVNYGTDETAEAVFQRAAAHADARAVHEHYAEALASAAKADRAEEVWSSMARRRDCAPDPKFWADYASFWFAQGKPDAGRALVKRADQSVVSGSATPAAARLSLLLKFAQIEYKLQGGDRERGRTAFEDLVATFPKRWDVWDVYVDMERKALGEGNDEVSHVRSLFSRMASAKMSKRRAAFTFKRWLAFEEKHGTPGDVEKVKSKAADVANALRAAQLDKE